MSTPRPFADLVDRFRRGDLSRRQFMARGAALGVGTASLLTIANTAVHAQTPQASPAASAAPVRPETGTEGQTRGAGGDLRILIWQAPTIAASHSALSDKDYIAASPVIEPLLHYLPDGGIVPNLLESVPSVENGLLAEDLSSVTLRLQEGLLWSDGTPVTAADIVFTWQWVITPSNAATSFSAWDTIASLEATGEIEAVATFKTPSITWFEPFTGGYNGNLYPAHAFGNDPANPNEAFKLAPIGTGPYVLESFTPGDSATYVANERYREPNKPFFARILLKGGGDPASATRAVLETSEYDYAWNLQVEPEVLAQIEGDGSRGHVYSAQGTTVESLNFNFSDPRTEVDGQVSQKDTPHPIFSDIAVRQAINLAVQRDVIADTLYTENEPATANLLAGVEAWDSPNTSWSYDLDEANRILDEAGWVRDGDVRAKDGVELAFQYVTTVTPVRQKTQLIVQKDLEALGMKVELVQIDSGIFFDASPTQEQNFYHMAWDLDEWTNGPYSSLPISYLNRWYAGPDGSNIAQKANNWGKDNTQRYQNPEFDALYERLLAATTVAEAEGLLIEANDLLIADVAAVPIVNRTVGVYALSPRVANDNVANGPSFVLALWNIANWTGPMG
jgi:peptide/nickel transport system substrate-binding protein